jgi:bifunctional UDP-N-acetylglucosamine pyrophosphorylase/glucosamine-1-phosphate N-acetyltransferase
MNRTMIIPAAGLGSRLQSSTPKVLFPVAGRPMIDRLLDLYSVWIDRFVLVLHPSFGDAVRRHCAARAERIEYAEQERPTGMLDAIRIPEKLVREHQPRQVWITWCDQIAVRPETVRRLAEMSDKHPEAAIVMPTLLRPQPYTHLVRNSSGTITDLLHRREGDILPDPGESEMGLFSLSANAYFELLPRFADEGWLGGATRERNFLPFIPWLAGKAAIKTFSAHEEIESVGVNDVHDLHRVEEYLMR